MANPNEIARALLYDFGYKRAYEYAVRKAIECNGQMAKDYLEASEILAYSGRKMEEP